MTTETVRLNVELQESERWRRTLNVTVPAERVREEREKIVRRLASRMKLPGFRSGHVPTRVVEQRYGAALQKETLDKVIGDAYKAAILQEELHPISEGEVEKVDYEPDQDLTFSVSFDVQPEIQIERVEGFVVERPSAEVGEGDVDQVLERLRDQNAVWEPVEEGTPETGDKVSVEVERLDLESDETLGDPQGYELVLGEGEAIPEVEGAIYTLTPGDSGTFTVHFPDDFPNEARRGEEERLRITLRARHSKRLPELDDAFARSLGDFDDLGALRERIQGDLAEEAADQAEAAVRGRLLESIVQANPFEVPRTMVDAYIRTVLGDTSKADPQRVAQAAEQLRPEAERSVKRILVLDTIAKTETLRATEEEVDARIQEIADKNGRNPGEVYAQLQKSGRLESLEREITERKVFDFLKGKSEIRDES